MMTYYILNMQNQVIALNLNLVKNLPNINLYIFDAHWLKIICILHSKCPRFFDQCIIQNKLCLSFRN